MSTKPSGILLMETVARLSPDSTPRTMYDLPASSRGGNARSDTAFHQKWVKSCILLALVSR